MSVQSIPSILVNGQPGQFAGGFIYNFNLTIGFNEGPNKLQLSMVLDNNRSNFSIPRLDLRRAYSISIGSFNFNGYLYTASEEYSPTEKLLHCTFVDKSILLDQVFVGLNERHKKIDRKSGASLSEEFLIMVGKEVYQEEQTQEEKETKTRCMNCDLEEIDVPIVDDGNCESEEENKNYDVMYLISDLLDEVEKIYPGLINRSGAPVSNGYASYTGTLREVLNSWCSDTGTNFFFDSITEKVYFANSFGGIAAPSLSMKNLKSYIKEQTKEGTYANGTGTFYTPNLKRDPNAANRTYTLNKEIYTPLTFVYNGPAWDYNATLGLMSSAGSAARDQYAIAMGDYQRLGILTNPLFPYVDFNQLMKSKLRDFGEAIGDTNLVDLASAPWISIILGASNPGVKDYFLNIERTAAENYGRSYKIQGPVPKINTKDVECQGSLLRKVTTYNHYPDFREDGAWTKDTGISSFGSANETWNVGITVYTLQGDTKDAFYNTFPEIAIHVPYGDPNGALFFLGEGEWFNISAAQNPSEEPFHTVENEQQEPYCPLLCEGQGNDVCDQYLASCRGDNYVMQQGITNTSSYSAGNVVAASAAPFKGWHKANQEYTKVFMATSSNQRKSPENSSTSMPDASQVAQSRFTLADTTNGGGLSGESFTTPDQASYTFEFIGLPEGISIDPKGGLASLSITLGSNGLFSRAVFQSRPPPPIQEKTLQKVVPRKTLFG